MKKVVLCSVDDGSVFGEFDSDIDFQAGDVITLGTEGNELFRVLDRVFNVSKPKEVSLVCFQPNAALDGDAEVEVLKTIVGQ